MNNTSFGSRHKFLLSAHSSQSHTTSCSSLMFLHWVNNKCNRVKGRCWIQLVYALHIFYYITMLCVFKSNHHCSRMFLKFHRKTPVLESTTNGMIFTLTFHIFCNSLPKSWYFSILSFSFCSILLSPGTAKSIILQILSFLSITTKSGPSFYNMISLNTEIPQDFITFILWNTFWLIFIPFISSFKITLSSKLPMYYFSQVIMPSLVLRFCKFTTTTNNMIYTFIYFSTHST